MKNFFTHILFFLSICCGFSQIDVAPSCLLLEGNDVEEIKILIDITNSGAEETIAFWTFEPAEDFPEDWQFQICDTKLCYGWDADTSGISSEFLHNTILPGQTVVFSLKASNRANTQVSTFPISGSSFGILRLYDDTGFTNQTGISESCSVSTGDLEIEKDLTIYPNPTADGFQIKNDKSIAHIGIYDAMGRLILNAKHSLGRSHDISMLRTGLYLVRLDDNKGEVVKAIWLSKR